MLGYHDLRGPRRRRHNRMLNQVRRAQNGVLYVRSEAEFRMVERLHRAGMVTACISKHDLLGSGHRAYREIAAFALEAEAMRRYDRALPR